MIIRQTNFKLQSYPALVWISGLCVATNIRFRLVTNLYGSVCLVRKKADKIWAISRIVAMSRIRESLPEFFYFQNAATVCAVCESVLRWVCVCVCRVTS